MADKKFGYNIDLQQNMLKNFIVDLQSSDPALAGLKEAQVYYYNGRLKVKNATAVKQIAYIDDTMTASAHTHSISEVTSLQTTLDGKQPTITGAATTIAAANLSVNYVLISDANGKVAASSVTSNELTYLSGVTSGIQIQLNGKENTANKGAANGYCPLDSNIKIPTAYLPGSIDDVLEAANLAALNALAAAEKMSNRMYVSLDTNVTYRWSGSAFVEISASVTISAATPQNVGATSAAGSSSQASAADHAHAIGADVVSNAMLANMAARTVKGNITGSTADPVDVTVDAFANNIAAGQNSIVSKIVAKNTAITPTALEASWLITTLPTTKQDAATGKYIANVKIYDYSTWTEIETVVSINQSTGVITAKWNTLNNNVIAADTFCAIVLA